MRPSNKICKKVLIYDLFSFIDDHRDLQKFEHFKKTQYFQNNQYQPH
jgi:hypothetical protein